ncbi:hypothetical protein A5668_09165 [Mycolicibacterium fortuitum]|uniref:hypothetical protein n=1 Tax=Mycolicibacterium fortuitum TaxID=1766 RepID=UPI0007EB21F8|nr:hypothetical protein [Mycolicibacterium fortuitum]OBA94660.1 hypothetical protein A5668_09165 [Mycolicibacterium fortuitum]
MIHATMPVHPATGLQAIGIGRRGPIWPVMGGSAPLGEPPAGDPPDPDPTPPPEPDEPLGEGGKKALDAEREARKTAESQAKDLQKQLDAANAQLKTAKNEGLPEWQQKFNELQEKLDGALAAQKQAEEAAKAATLAQLRTDRAAEKGLPAVLAKKLTGTTAEELDAEIDELLPHLGAPGPKPNPQQGNPSQARGGSLAAGRERYAAAHPK